MQILIHRSLLIILVIAISCKQNQELSKMTLYFDNGVKKSGFTPRESYFDRSEILEWRKKEKGIWFHEITAEYLQAYTIDSDSFSIIPLYSKSKTFAINKITGSIDLYLYPHIVDSCTTSDLLEALDFMGDIFEFASILTGGEQCPNEYDFFEDDDCQKIIRYPTQSYILVNRKLKKRLFISESNFFLDQLLEFFSNYPSFQKKLYENAYAFKDLHSIVSCFNSLNLVENVDASRRIGSIGLETKNVR